MFTKWNGFVTSLWKMLRCRNFSNFPHWHTLWWLFWYTYGPNAFLFFLWFSVTIQWQRTRLPMTWLCCLFRQFVTKEITCPEVIIKKEHLWNIKMILPNNIFCLLWICPSSFYVVTYKYLFIGNICRNLNKDPVQFDAYVLDFEIEV